MGALRQAARHALIIEDNMIVGHAIEQQLIRLGFQSFDHAWTEKQAVDLARRHLPDLVVVGDTLETGSPMAAARKISEFGDVPILLATADSFQAKRQLPADASLKGPFRIDQLGAAIDLAGSEEVSNVVQLSTAAARRTEPAISRTAPPV